ncbi:Dihydrofolate reductase type 3 [Candidatus Terasakiella magnetica]|uniref:Dihydrofolate reductase n=1 Tax=Candidatus Terasakiella magnetica TaxID=1867952 RepID=A0A1C3RJK1_9PROT|nr:dihydrofolate reductase [Candidatus Terasakiella magnetica]SCA57446.1 Dihydrofolate reductase type 3 [Candidatus Terasakiella magnetica]
MLISMIVAVAENGAIGKGNKMLWHIPEDFKYFKATTMGKPIIMGRKTYESIGRPLPGRLNVVITRDKSWFAQGVSTVNSLRGALNLASDNASEEIFIVGGSTIYEQSMQYAERIHITEVHDTYEADAFFPKLDDAVWKEVSREDHQGDGEKKPDYSFVVYERITP